MPTIKEIKKYAKLDKTKPNYYFRWISVFPTKLFLYLPFTPNQITALSLLMAVVGIFLFNFGGYIYPIIGVLILAASVVIDCVDGNIARYRKQFSKITLESNCSVILKILFFLFLVFRLYRVNHNFNFIILGFVWLSSYFLGYFYAYRALDIRLRSIQSDMKGEDKDEIKLRRSRINKLFQSLFSASHQLPILLVAAILNRLDIFLYFYTTAYFIRAVTRAYVFIVYQQ